jgi:quercetin dioxygenase-like cupin family protein
MFRFGVMTVMALGVLQDPTASLPHAYKVQFENEYVRVVRVHYDAGAKLPEHTHAAGTTAYVYLNDSEGVVFSHVGGSNRAVTRPPVKPGAIRIASGPEEHHTAENTSSTPSDFLRVYFKTDAGGVRNLRQRLSPTDEFSNKQLRVTRLKIETHETTTITAKEPALFIELPSGAEQWVEAGASKSFENHDARPLELVRFDFLTKPQ